MLRAVIMVRCEENGETFYGHLLTSDPDAPDVPDIEHVAKTRDEYERVKRTVQSFLAVVAEDDAAGAAGAS